MGDSFDLVIIGAGVIGCAVARAAKLKFPRISVLVLEREPHPAMHQSGRNSGVVHVGYNQKPGTSKAKLVVEGSRRLRAFCKERKVPLAEDGIVVVARNAEEEATITELHRRGVENGANVHLVSKKRLNDLEPHAIGNSALFAPDGASFDSKTFVAELCNEFTSLGGQLSVGEDVQQVEEHSTHVEIRTNRRTIRADALINAGGLHADRIAHQLGLGLDFQIIPFRGEYHQLRPERASLVRAHVYAPPDLKYPFLGVHFSRTFDGRVTVGPGAVLAMGRHAYEPLQADFGDLKEMLSFGGFWRMLSSKEFTMMASKEWRKSLFKVFVYKESAQLVPEVTLDDFIPYRAGIRAQVVSKEGKLIDDLVVETSPRTVHVLNAVSPALTCSLPFADHIVSVLEGKIACSIS